MEEIDALRDRAREDKYARLGMAERGDPSNITEKQDDSNVIQLSYSQYNKIQQKKIDSYSIDSMFRSTVPNNMLPRVPKPTLI